MKTFCIKTLGCKVNQYESDGISIGLEKQGLKKSSGQTGADVYIVNTCAVTSKAGMQSRQAIRKIIRENPEAKVIVTGCHAQTDPEQMNRIEHIDQVVCHRDKAKIAKQITSLLNDPSGLNFSQPDHDRKSAGFQDFDHTVKGDMTRAYLKIQDGCDAFCTYCIVPYARGASVSMAEKDVFLHLAELNRSGFKEVILTGIHTGMYGQDFKKQTTLVELIEKIDRQKPVHRIRLSSIEPTEISEDLIRLAGPDHVMCNHFHIPLQSGDDEILKKMKRPYTADLFKNIVHSLTKMVPDVGIGADILVGFPTETDQQFENTCTLVKKLPLSYLHVFPFSPRKGTPAFHFKPKVASIKIKERTQYLRTLDRAKRKAFIDLNAGKVLEGLVQHKTDSNTGMLKAVTSNYLTVLLDPASGVKGEIINLVIEDCDDNLVLKGKIV